MKPRTRPARVPLTHLVSLGSRLTDRDRQIVLDCYEHNVLTTGQLQRLHFAGLRAAERRLNTLYQLRVLDRFRPPIRPGTGIQRELAEKAASGALRSAASRGERRRCIRRT